MVHQHFQLIPVFTVVENVVLGDELRTRAVLDLDTARAPHRRARRALRARVDPDAKVEDLSVGEQQRVELFKALFRDADILILDEPTAVLDARARSTSSSASSAASSTRASRSCSSPTSCARCSRSPTASPCSATDASSVPPTPTTRPSSASPR